MIWGILLPTCPCAGLSYPISQPSCIFWFSFNSFPWIPFQWAANWTMGAKKVAANTAKHGSLFSPQGWRHRLPCTTGSIPSAFLSTPQPMLPTTIAPISGHHRSGSLSQSQDHHAQNNIYSPNHQLDGPHPSFDTRGRPVPGVCFVQFVILIDRAHTLIQLLFRLLNLLGTNLRTTSSSLTMERERRNLIMNSSSLISIVKVDWRKNKLCIFWSTPPRFSRRRLIWFLSRVLLQVRSCCLYWVLSDSSQRCVVCGDIHGQYVSHSCCAPYHRKRFSPSTTFMFCSMIWWNCSRWAARWRKVRIFSLEITWIEEISVLRYTPACSPVPLLYVNILAKHFFSSSVSYTYMLAKSGVHTDWLCYGVTTNVAI